jgi:hypothetical protein
MNYAMEEPKELVVARLRPSALFGAAPADSGSLSRVTVQVLFMKADFLSLSSLSQSRLGPEELFFHGFTGSGI